MPSNQQQLVCLFIGAEDGQTVRVSAVNREVFVTFRVHCQFSSFIVFVFDFISVKIGDTKY